MSWWGRRFWLVVLVLLAAPPAWATTFTVCAPDHPDAPCTFTSIAACVGTAPGDGDICEVRSGLYSEEVVSAFGAPTDLQVLCAPGQSCVLDGQGVLATAIDAEGTWDLRGFEVRHYLGPVLSDLEDVSDCSLHDNFGDVIFRARGVVERNRIQRAVGSALVGTGSFSPLIVRRNLITDVAGLFSDAALEHNTLVRIVGSTTGATITADRLAYNVIYNERDKTVSVLVTGTPVGTSEYNLFGGSADPLHSTFDAIPVGDVYGDPLFVGYEDFRLMPGSPAIDLAATSTDTTDLDGDPVAGTPDAGAFEHDALDTDQTDTWTVREVLGRGTYRTPRPQLAYVEGQGPVLALFDVDLDRKDMVFAARRDDGSWYTEPFAPALISGTNPDINGLDLAVSPSGVPSVAYVYTGSHEGAPGAHVYFAERLGDGCGTTCDSPQWRGCATDLVDSLGSGDEVGVKLVFDPVTGEPVVAVRSEQNNGCASGVDYGTLVVYRKSGGTWSSALVDETDCIAQERLSQDFEVLIDEAGRIELVYAMAVDQSTYALGEVRVASDPGGGFVPEAVPLISPFAGHRQDRPLAAALASDGTLGLFWSTAGGLAFVERDPGSTWGVEEVVMPTFSANPLTGRAAHLVYDSLDEPILVSGSLGFHVFVHEYVDGWVAHRLLDRDSREQGHGQHQPVELLLFDGDERALALHRYTGSGGAGFDVEFFASVEPGGRPAAYEDPGECDGCPSDPDKSEPGLCGCGVPDSDTDGDGVLDCNDTRPAVVDDSATLDEDALDTEIDVLANDDFGANGAASLEVFSDGSHGTAVVDDRLTADVFDDVLRYTPDANYNGPDELTYRICDTDNDCDLATVTLTITPQPDPPTPQPDAYEVPAGTSIDLDLADNDTDLDGDLDPTTANTDCDGCSEPAQGALTNNGDGSFGYDAPLAASGSDDFVYEICDLGGLCATALVEITITAAPAELLIQEMVTVGEAAGALGPATLAIAETVSIDDLTALVPPAWLLLAEAVSVVEVRSLLGPADLLIAEVVAVGEGGRAQGPVTLLLAEVVAVSEGTLAFGPAVLNVAEEVAVAVQEGLIGPVTLAFAETVSIVEDGSTEAEPGDADTDGNIDTADTADPADSGDPSGGRGPICSVAPGTTPHPLFYLVLGGLLLRRRQPDPYQGETT